MDSLYRAYQALFAAYHIPFVMQKIDLENEFILTPG